MIFRSSIYWKDKYRRTSVRARVKVVDPLLIACPFTLTRRINWTSLRKPIKYTDSATNYNSVFESSIYAPLTDATYNSASLTLKPQYQRKFALPKVTGAVKKSCDKKAQNAAHSATGSVEFKDLDLLPIVNKCQPSDSSTHDLSCEKSNDSLTGRTLVAAEDLAQCIKKHVQFAESQSKPHNSTLLYATKDANNNKASSLVKEPSLPLFLRRKRRYNIERHLRTHRRKPQKRLRHNFNYHTFSKTTAFPPVTCSRNDFSEITESENDTETILSVHEPSISTSPTEISKAEPLKASAASETSITTVAKGRNLKRRTKLAHLIAFPVLALSPVIKRASERMWNGYYSKHDLVQQSTQQQQRSLPSSDKIQTHENDYSEKINHSANTPDTTQNQKFKAVYEENMLSSLAAIATPYLQACLDDMSSPTTKTECSTAGSSLGEPTTKTDHQSHLEQLLAKHADTPVTVNALVLEHLLFNFDKLQVQELVPSEMSTFEPTPVEQQQHTRHWIENSYLDRNSDYSDTAEIAGHTDNHNRFEHHAPASFSSACSTKYVPSPGMFSANTNALKLNRNEGFDSASTSSYEDVEFLW